MVLCLELRHLSLQGIYLREKQQLRALSTPRRLYTLYMEITALYQIIFQKNQIYILEIVYMEELVAQF